MMNILESTGGGVKEMIRRGVLFDTPTSTTTTSSSSSSTSSSSFSYLSSTTRRRFLCGDTFLLRFVCVGFVALLLLLRLLRPLRQLRLFVASFKSAAQHRRLMNQLRFVNRFLRCSTTQTIIGRVHRPTPSFRSWEVRMRSAGMRTTRPTGRSRNWGKLADRRRMLADWCGLPDMETPLIQLDRCPF